MSFQELFDRQAGVVRRAQLLDLGASPHDLRRWIRQRRLVRVYPGVYVNHTGPLTWTHRAWAAVLVNWPAALADVSAINTVRLGWRHAEDQPCRTAARLAVLLRDRGWRGRPRRCGHDCSTGTTPTISVIQ